MKYHRFNEQKRYGNEMSNAQNEGENGKRISAQKQIIIEARGKNSERRTCIVPFYGERRKKNADFFLYPHFPIDRTWNLLQKYEITIDLHRFQQLLFFFLVSISKPNTFYLAGRVWFVFDTCASSSSAISVRGFVVNLNISSFVAGLSPKTDVI